MDNKELLKKAKEEEEKHIPSMEEINKEEEEFEKTDEKAYKLLKSSVDKKESKAVKSSLKK